MTSFYKTETFRPSTVNVSSQDNLDMHKKKDFSTVGLVIDSWSVDQMGFSTAY